MSSCLQICPPSQNTPNSISQLDVFNCSLLESSSPHFLLPKSSLLSPTKLPKENCEYAVTIALPGRVDFEANKSPGRVSKNQPFLDSLRLSKLTRPGIFDGAKLTRAGGCCCCVKRQLFGALGVHFRRVSGKIPSSPLLLTPGVARELRQVAG